MEWSCSRLRGLGDMQHELREEKQARALLDMRKSERWPQSLKVRVKGEKRCMPGDAPRVAVTRRRVFRPNKARGVAEGAVGLKLRQRPPTSSAS